jgi:hypothetical protein
VAQKLPDALTHHAMNNMVLFFFRTYGSDNLFWIFLSHFIEPLAFLLLFASLHFYHRKVDAGIQYKMLYRYYLVATLIMFVSSQLDFNPPMYNLLYLLTGMSIGYFFYKTLQSRFKKNLALAGITITITYYFVSNLMNGFDQIFDSNGHVLSSTCIVVLIFLYLHQVLTNVNEDPLSQNFDFWFVCVQLVYHLSSFAIFLSYNYFTHRFFLERHESKEIGTILTTLWVVHNVILFLSAVTISLSIAWIYRRKSLSL